MEAAIGVKFPIGSERARYVAGPGGGSRAAAGALLLQSIADGRKRTGVNA